MKILNSVFNTKFLFGIVNKYEDKIHEFKNNIAKLPINLNIYLNDVLNNLKFEVNL